MKTGLSYLNPNPVVNGHRGFAAKYPENTLLSFEKALEAGADSLEMDVRLSKDGVCAISHDDELERTTGEQKKISKLDYSQILELDAGYGFSEDGRNFPFRGSGLQIPTLEEVLDKFPKAKIILDLKEESEQLTEKVAKIIKARKIAAQICVGSHHLENLKRIRKILPEVTTSFAEKEVLYLFIQHKLGLIPFRRKFPAELFQIPEFHNSLRIVTPRFVRSFKKKGLKIQVWVVNDPQDIRRLLEMGVDGITTDNPALAKKIAKEIKV